MSILKAQKQSYLNQSYSTARSQAFYVDSDTLLQYLAPNVDTLRQDELDSIVHDLLYSYAMDHALYVQGERLVFIADYLSYMGVDFICTDRLAHTYLERLNRLFEDCGIDTENVLIDVYPIPGTPSAVFNIQEM